MAIFFKLPEDYYYSKGFSRSQEAIKKNLKWSKNHLGEY